MRFGPATLRAARSPHWRTYRIPSLPRLPGSVELSPYIRDHLRSLALAADTYLLAWVVAGSTNSASLVLPGVARAVCLLRVMVVHVFGISCGLTFVIPVLIFLTYAIRTA